MAQGEVKELNLIIKADVGGSAEVLTDTLTKLSTNKVRIRVLHTGVGAINESDVLLASASEAIVIGFNVKPDRTAAAAAEHEQVDIRLHSIIYALTDEIKKAMVGLLGPTYKEIYMGKAEVRQTFKVSKVGMVAGCMVLDGTINRNCKLRVTRGKEIIILTKVTSLKRFQRRRERSSDGNGMRHCSGSVRRNPDGRFCWKRSSRRRWSARSPNSSMPAAVGVLTFELRLEHSHSLKDKRQVVKSLKDRLRSRFNVAVAEIGEQEMWQRAIVAAVTISSDQKAAEEALQRGR